MKTLISLLDESVAKYPDNIYLWEKTTGAYVGTTYSETKNQVLRIAAGLLALGIRHADRIALLSEGRNAWIISELGILHAGACCVPLSVKLDAATDLKFRLLHSGSRVVFVSGQHLTKINEIRDLLPDLERVICFDDIAGNDLLRDNDLTWQMLLETGYDFLLTRKDQLDASIASVKSDYLANISYTSGTMADPKGIMLTHLNYYTNVQQALTLMVIPPTHRTLAILPWDHSFAHTACLYCFMAMGASVGSVQTGNSLMETLRNVPLNIKELKPHIIMSVPALSRNFRKNIEAGIEQKGKAAKALLAHALSVAYQYNGNGNNRGKGWRALLKPLVRLHDKLLFQKIRQGFGGQMEFFIGGGALLDIELQRFFYAIGIPVCQGYGLSEAAPVISSNSLANIKLGTSGRPVDFLDIKICDIDGKELPVGVSGEIVIRGDNVMKGYWKNQKATDEVLRGGWLFTGDMGYIDDDGYIIVLGRFKSLLIGNDGEKYSPEGIEESIIDKSHYISQCILHNNQQPYTVGLLVPAINTINSHLEKEGIVPGSPEGIDAALELISDDIKAFYGRGKHAGEFPERWLPSNVCVLPEAFTEQNQLMNSTLKIVRAKVTEKYAFELEFLYNPMAKSIINEVNRRNMARWYNH
jgi:long-chain acyl-CoA synthetase